MSRTKAIMGSMAAHKWIVLTVAGALVSVQALAQAAPVAPVSAQSSAAGPISVQEQPDGRTRLTIRASAKPKFTTWKMERPSRVVVDITGATVAGVEAPFDAGTFAVGNVSAGTEASKTRVTLTLRRGADYQVEAQGNTIVVDVTPWEAPPTAAVAADPALLQAARKEAAEAARARMEAEARANKAEAEAHKAVAAANEAQATVKSLAEEKQQAERARQEAAVQAARTVAEERKQAELAKQQAATQAARSVAEERRQAQLAKQEAAAQAALLVAEERKQAQLAKQEAAAQAALLVAEERKQSQLAKQEAAALAARVVAEERRQAEQARQQAASQVRQTAAEATAKLDAERAALEASRAKAEAAQVQAARMAEALAVERAAIERARKGVEDAARAAAVAKQAATDGQRREEQEASDKAAKHLAKEQAALDVRRAQAQASEQAAAQAMQRLALQTREVESRQQQAEQARAQALAAAQMLEKDRQQAASARAEAERLRANAEDADRKAKALLQAALAEQKRAEDRQKQGRQDDAQATRVVAEARQQTEQARTAAEAARAEVARSEAERKRLVNEREALAKQQAALAMAEQQAAAVAKRANDVTAKAAAVEAAMAQLEREKQTLAMQRKALEAEQATIAAAAKANAADREQIDNKASSFEKAMKDQQLALAKAAAAQEREQARLLQAEQALALTKSELAKREQALASAKKDAQGKRASDEQAKLDAAEAALKKALAAHAEAEQHRQAQEDKLNALALERQALEASRTKMGQELDAVKSELASAKAEVARLKAVPKSAPVVATAPAAVRPPAAHPAPAVVEENHAVYAAAERPHSITLRVPSRVSRIDFVDEPARSSVIIDMEEPTDFSIERSTGRRVTLRLHHADLPKLLERSMDATQYFGPVRLINSYRDPNERGAVRVEVELAEMVPNRVRTDGARLYWDFDKARPGSAATRDVFALPAVQVAAFHAVLPVLIAQEGAGSSRRPPASKKRFTGRRIDLDFKGADIHNILRLLAEVGGVNIVTSDDVKGEVTIKMRDVPWDQALDVVLRAKTLGQVREGNLIRVAPIQVLEKELEQEISKQKQMTEVMPTETRLIGVSYAEAKELESRAKDLLSARGKVSVDERTNNLIVSDVAKNLALVEELVRNLDTQTSQVVIEARIIEARSTFVRALGVQWGGTTFLDAEHGNPTGLVFPNSVGIGGGATDSIGSTQGLVPGPRSGIAGTASQSPNYAVNLPAAVGAGSGGALGLTLGSVAGALNLNLRLSALEQSGQVRILSSPRISTMDNVQASIEQGVAIPISVVSAQGVQTVFVDAKLNLTVKPHVTNEGTVILTVHVTRNEPDFVNTGARGDPTILKKEAKTVMLVRDGDTAVIGGIYQRNSGLNYSKVPFFADIPIVGFFFRNRKENDDRTEFLVFITPRIANRSRSLAQ